LLLIPGSGDPPAHLAHIDDVVAAALHLVYVMEHQKISGRIFNIADDTPCTLRELLEMIAEILRVRPPSVRVPASTVRVLGTLLPYGYSMPFYGIEREELPHFLRSNVYDNTALKGTGYTMKYPQTRLGLEATFDWYARHGRLERVWYATHPGWRTYWRRIAPEDRPFADYALVHRTRPAI